MSDFDLGEQLEKDFPELQAKGKPDRLFKLVRIGQIETKLPEWIIKGLIPRDSLILGFGDPGCGKSFWSIDVACCVSTGTCFHGLKVKTGQPVVYVAGEGQNGLKRRFMAWSIYHGIDIDSAPLFVSVMPANLTDRESLDSVVGAIDEVASSAGEPALIVIDTVARNFGPGDENSTQDMGRFIQAADEIRGKYRSTILLIHHTGHSDKSRARGAMALKGALDAEYRLDKDETGTVRLEATKMKDTEYPESMAFEFKVIELPLWDEEGEPVTSVVLTSTGYEPPAKPGTTGKGKHQVKAFDILNSIYLARQKELTKESRDPATARISIDEWKIALRGNDIPRQRIGDVIDSLKRLGQVSEVGGFVYPGTCPVVRPVRSYRPTGQDRTPETGEPDRTGQNRTQNGHQTGQEADVEIF